MHLPVKPMTIPAGASFAMPFNMVMGTAVLHHATCQSLATCGSTWFFYAPDEVAAEFAFYEEGIAGIACNSAIRRKQNGLWLVDGLQPGRDCWFVVGCADGSTVSVCVLDERLSLMLHKYELTGGELLLMTDPQTWQDNGELVLTKRGSTEFEVWTYPAVGVGGGWEEQMIGRNMRLSTSVPVAAAAGIRIEPVELTETKGKWNVTVAAELPAQVEELFLIIEYEGAKGTLMLDGKRIPDNSHDGRPWEVGIKLFLSDKKEITLELEILALSVDEDISVESDYRPQGNLLQLKGIISKYEYRAVMPDFI